MKEKKIIIFGAGRNGRYLLNRLPVDSVLCYADNDPKKWGTNYVGLPVISFEELKKETEIKEIQVILSVNSDEMREQLKANGIAFFNIFGQENNYFMRPGVQQKIDGDLMRRYLWDTCLLDATYFQTTGNWFREEFYSEGNREYIDVLKNASLKEVAEYLEPMYAKSGIAEDELYENRPGMRLIASILEQEAHICGGNTCDLACGHGALLKVLRKKGFEVIGVEQSMTRTEYVNSCGVPCICSGIESVPCKDQTFDAVICLECLEHIRDPHVVVKEMRRLLKKGGIAFCTVPYGKNCDCPAHVRQFNASSLYSLFKMNGFEVINLMQIPYLNYSLTDDNLFLIAKTDISDRE